MIKGWNYLTMAHGGIAGIFLSILFLGEPNMFTIPLIAVFVLSTIYCAMQWHLMNLFEKVEKRQRRYHG